MRRPCPSAPCSETPGSRGHRRRSAPARAGGECACAPTTGGAVGGPAGAWVPQRPCAPCQLGVRRWPPEYWQVGDGVGEERVAAAPEYYTEALEEELVRPLVRRPPGLLWRREPAERGGQGARAGGLHQPPRGAPVPGHSASRREAQRLPAAGRLPRGEDYQPLCGKPGRLSGLEVYAPGLQDKHGLCWRGSPLRRPRGGCPPSIHGLRCSGPRGVWLLPIRHCVRAGRAGCLRCQRAGLRGPLPVPLRRALRAAACPPRRRPGAAPRRRRRPGSRHAGRGRHGNGPWVPVLGLLGPGAGRAGR